MDAQLDQFNQPGLDATGRQVSLGTTSTLAVATARGMLTSAVLVGSTWSWRIASSRATPRKAPAIC